MRRKPGKPFMGSTNALREEARIAILFANHTREIVVAQANASIGNALNN